MTTDGPFFGPPRPPRRASPPAGVFPTPDEIAERAYELCASDEVRGRDITEYWRRAEDELLDLAARRATR
jgi:hypothetical protein